MRISRIYVDRFGSPTSWYEGMTFDLCEPVTGEAIDSCMNLENAGGKTSLLSYIFSCFEPKQDRWLQHLQSSSHAFRDYFARDIRPSFMIIEWIMPSRSPNGQNYRLVIGQAVQLKESADRASEVDRRFFAFESSPALAWEHLPVPGISMAPVQSLQEFLNWGHQTARVQSQGDFHMIVNQGDWVAHLEQRRLIDVELLKMQLSFNSREGGSEEGFLSFSSESDLVSKLLHLSMNQEHTDALRDMVAQTMDRLKAKPKHEARLHQLKLLQQWMKPFSESAAELLGAKAALLEVEQQAADTLFTMRDQVNGLDVRLANANTAISQLQQMADLAAAEAVSSKHNHHALIGLELSRADEAAKEKSQSLHTALQAGQARLECLSGALIKREIASVEKLIQELTQQADALKAELKPFEDDADRMGAMLRYVISQHIAKHQAKGNELVAQEREGNTSLNKIAQQRQWANDRKATLKGSKGAVEQSIKSAIQFQEGLIEGGWLLPTDIDVAAAIERLSTAIEELKARFDDLKEQRVTKKAALAQAQAEAADAMQQVTQARVEQVPLNQWLRNYDHRVETLQNDPALATLVEGLCDPHSTALVTQVQHFIESTRTQMSDCTIRLKQLKEQQLSVEQSGLAGRSDDVDLVVHALHGAGIRSARAANTYVADLRPDAPDARALVLSDPARFLGVNVAKDEWPKAVHAARSMQLSLSLPVTLAIASLDVEPTADDRYVFGPEKDAIFNKRAAQEVLAECENLIRAVEAGYDAFAEREIKAQSSLAGLQAFQRDYSRESIQQTVDALEQLQRDAEVAEAKHAEHSEIARRVDGEVEALNGLIETLPGEISTLGDGLQRLSDYAANWEPRIASGRKELAEISRELGQVETSLAQMKADEDAGKASLRDIRSEQSKCVRAVDLLQNEFEQVSRCDTAHDASAEVLEKGYDLKTLRDLYAHAYAMLTTQEKDKLGVIGAQLEMQRRQVSRLTEQYQSDFGRLDVTLVDALVSTDIEAEIESQKRLNGRTADEKEEAAHSLGVASSQLQAFRKEHPSVHPTPEMMALEDDELPALAARELSHSQTKTEEAESINRQIVQKRADVANDVKQKATLETHIKLLTSSFTANNLVPKLIDLGDEIGDRVADLLSTWRRRGDAVSGLRSKTDKAHRDLLKVATNVDFVVVEGEVSAYISQDDFEKACLDHQRLVEMVDDRVASVTDQLDKMTPDFESCVTEVYNQATSASSLVKHAVGITMPLGTPYVSGKPILKMAANLTGKTPDQRKIEIRHYLNSQIESGVVPRTGADIITQCLLSFTSHRSFGLQMLKMEQNAAFQYQSVNDMKKSGGQGTVIATFLYMLISHMRVNTQTQAKRGGGGPLLLDNPFANVQTRALIDAQRILAASLGIQLICFTANADANILEGFRRIIRLRKAGVNSKTNRTHIEMAKATFAEMAS